MTNGKAVTVLQMPEHLTREQAHLFLQEFEPLVSGDRPRVVFDFSKVRQLGSVGVELLLRCMEEVMKRNGDLKLAAVSAGPMAVLEFTGIDGLFEIFADAAQAVDSFYQVPAEVFEQVPPVWYPSIAHESELP
jgi:anti-sigma B factor antagonist